ncbi:hypothetical protein H6G20_02310 [Desertifilum sp. FACHB-1129]|uniref:Uncharacterized protein n=2 Tax=Cyanophyceae TaxID=3028117 RepID=A0A1E5QDV5_9CYAN|nr:MULTISPECIES: hypothetical protein [Cyanophyceae]MDA0209026.1 hypothetical protein [Cyanobacteria bacterium FC1]MDI9638121.1 hypothetical protein [Geitlerinema splendidum]MDK3158069.1 hypothetical protein [Kamptonema cortianum]MDL5044729.1 hypothetical protein [Oscillatoria amoena NRMC-F 0135]MBD2310508.1 hypothetical protein [Desertifilum sp. FACHB-1129]
MSSSAEKSSTAKSPLTAQTIVLAGVTWAVAALLFFLLFGATPPGESPPTWYLLGTYIFGFVANLSAAILCLRNWRSPQIVSGRNVWLGIGLGLFLYVIGDILFFLWEFVWEQDPVVSPGDFFYLLNYLCLSWGMMLAVTSRRLNLELKQWIAIAAIGIVGMALAVWLSLPPSMSGLASTSQTPTAPTPAATTPAPAPAASRAPDWVVKLEEDLAPLDKPVTLIYTVFDVALLIAATTLLLAFWGGRFSQSWRMIAAAAFCLYIADMWFKYAATRVPDYQSGGILEVFWVFSPLLFGIGAALEYDISTRTPTRRAGRRRS